eukprot:COSAG06_NODE_4483_length_4210_cov_6.595817_4_plen_101_part_00
MEDLPLAVPSSPPPPSVRVLVRPPTPPAQPNASAARARGTPPLSTAALPSARALLRAPVARPRARAGNRTFAAPPPYTRRGDGAVCLPVLRPCKSALYPS